MKKRKRCRECGGVLGVGIDPCNCHDIKTTKILVCGSRTWQHPDMILNALKRFDKEYENLIIIHGGAEHGADDMCYQACRLLDISQYVFSANWNRYGKPAGIIRNNEMLGQDPDLVVAFHRGNSPGTHHTVSEARKRGIPTRVFKDNG